MPIQLILTLVKYIIIPLVIAASIYYSGYRSGSEHVSAQWNAQKRDAEVLLYKSMDRISQLTRDAETANRTIEALNHEHNQKIDAVRRDAADDLDRRLRRDAAKTDCRAVSPAAETAGRGDDAGAAAAVVFSERVAHRLEQRHEQADRLTESLRACRAYITSLKDYGK